MQQTPKHAVETNKPDQLPKISNIGKAGCEQVWMLKNIWLFVLGIFPAATNWFGDIQAHAIAISASKSL